ncbi:hypothetical protein [Croceicoccus sp. Ery15]|uniref:hypothetical protein n=1 Tax=Croceicoccus sp. Ery15 TaxID=1703338 RepID=UPI001E5084CB|nr:hypothetical protein [Croceicoccus sp. Ery15]
MIKNYFDWIWHVRDSVELPAGQSPKEALDRLEPLFHERGTSFERHGNTISFGKKGQPAQDRMSVFDRGELVVESDGTASRLSYHLVSRAFLYCFFAPLLFLAFAQMNTLVRDYERASAAAEMAAEGDKAKEEKEDKILPQSPIDKFLGAPTPEMPDKDKEKDLDKIGPSPTPAYVFACIFVVLYIGGRILETRLVKRLFRRRMRGEDREPVGPAQVVASV